MAPIIDRATIEIGITFITLDVGMTHANNARTPPTATNARVQRRIGTNGGIGPATKANNTVNQSLITHLALVATLTLARASGINKIPNTPADQNMIAVLIIATTFNGDNGVRAKPPANSSGRSSHANNLLKLPF